MATHDPLTGLYNRAYLNEEMERLAAGRSFPVTFVVADLEALREINRLYGHDAGDRRCSSPWVPPLRSREWISPRPSAAQTCRCTARRREPPERKRDLMPTLVIDNRTVEVPEGANVLEAAKKLGLVVPHFCYHDTLGSVGACRLCAVKFLEGPVKGIQMSCMIKAQDGMVVSTLDAEAADMRSLVIEWLMINHPHDCPVCDEGGECLLQDFTIAGGHGRRRYRGKKRTFLNQDLGPYIHHEMNRCIECYRCRRFYQDYAGGTDFGVLGSAGRVYFGRFQEGKLESPFSGNLVDICPTGVFTDKPARYRARYWDYEMAPSVCTRCSLGCGVIPVCRYRELIKIVPRRNDAVNGWFICDAARFDRDEVNAPARPRQPLLQQREATWEEALQGVAERLRGVVREKGPEALLLAGSTGMSLEAILLLVRLSQVLGCRFSLFATQEEAERTAAAVEAVLVGTGVSLAELQRADLVAIHGCDLMEEAPMAALAVRQAWRRGGKVILSDSPAEGLPFPVESFGHIAEACGSGCLRQVIIFGTRHYSASSIRRITGMKVPLFPVLQGANSFGAVMAAEGKGVALDTALAGGKVAAVFVVETQLPQLPGMEVVAAVDWRATETVQAADAVLPVAAWTEAEATWVNNEGRAQRSCKAMAPGRPLRGLPPRYYGAPEKPAPLHPPRVPRRIAPGGDLPPSWKLLHRLLELLGDEPPEHPLSGRWESLREIDPEGEGVRIR